MSSTQPKPLSAKRQKTRDRLIQAAAQAIGEKGFHAITLDQIAARAGLTKGAIYDNFANKEALFFAVIQANPSSLPFPESSPDATSSQRARDLAAAIVSTAENTRMQIPLRAEFLLYTLAHPELRDNVREWMARGFAKSQTRLLERFTPEELPMAADRFIMLLEAMVPGLIYLRSQAPDLVTDEAIADILEGLFRPRITE